jgi:hypothetical protein
MSSTHSLGYIFVILTLLHVHKKKEYRITVRTQFYLRKNKLHASVIYRVSQEERSIFWEVIVSVILSKKRYINTCPIPNGFRDRVI